MARKNASGDRGQTPASAAGPGLWPGCPRWAKQALAAMRRCPQEYITARVRVGFRSVRGNVRSRNEDRCYVDSTHRLFLVADGMGGYYGGAKASQILIESIPSRLMEAVQIGDCDLAQMTAAVREAAQIARRQMIEFAEGHHRFREMGCTMALAALVQDQAFISHVGDSRVYLLRSGHLRQLTVDETYVQALLNAQAITAAQAHDHVMRNIVLNSIGLTSMDHEPIVSQIRLRPQDTLLLTTDGLTDFVEDRSLCEILLAHAKPQAAADQLILCALQNESRDNISCIVVRVDQLLARVFEATDESAMLETAVA